MVDIKALLRGSGPARGLWIEIDFSTNEELGYEKSGPARGLWIEIVLLAGQCRRVESGPARGLWIEIQKANEEMQLYNVGPRKGPVD